MIDDAFTRYEEDKLKGGTGHAIEAEAEAAPMSAEELAALGSAAHDLIPEESFLVGKPLKWGWETGRWFFDVINGKNVDQILVADDEEFGVDLRSYAGTVTRWEE